MKCVVFAAAAMLAVASPALADVTFFDGAGQFANYELSIYGGQGLTISAQRSLYDLDGALFTGVFGTYAELRNPEAPRFQFLNTTFIYDPSTEGAIGSIDASLGQDLARFAGDRAVRSTTLPPFELRILARQDGVLYQAVTYPGGLYNLITMRTASVTGLVASDFKAFDPANPWSPLTSTGLDFAGSAITFGFELAHFAFPDGEIAAADAPSRSTIHADDFQITVRSAVPGNPGAVPEPATWAMLILGFGCVGSVVRRRRSVFA